MITRGFALALSRVSVCPATWGSSWEAAGTPKDESGGLLPRLGLKRQLWF